MKYKLILVTLAFNLLSCSETSTDTSSKNTSSGISSDEFTNLECGAFQSVKTPIGDLQNNVWNQHSSKNFDWSQCLIKREREGKTEYGWAWRWPENGSEIYAQPQVTLGQTPWIGHETPYEAYPIALSTLEELVFDYDVEINGNSKLNLTATLWMTNSPEIPKVADKSTITAELMIWTYSNQGFYANPAGKKHSEMNVDGVDWEVWVNTHWYDTSGLNDNTWRYIAFRAKQNALAIRYDAAKLIRYSIENGLIEKDFYIADIQLGNEVMSGSGQAWLRKFDVAISKE